MLKNILNLKSAQKLSKNEQKAVSGGWDTGYCDRLYATHNCGHPNWENCGFDPCDDSCFIAPGGC